MIARRSVSLVLVWLCGVAGGLLLWSAPALAQRMHVFSKSFGSEGTGNGQFSRPGAIAVNESTGDVYVIDRGNGRVEIFSATGAYLSQFTPPSGAFSFADTGRGFETEGTIAVDNSTDPLDPSAGDVYVQYGEGIFKEIDKFSASGVYIGQISREAGSNPPIATANGVAVDANGTLWVEGDSENGYIYEFNDASTNEYVSKVHLEFQTTPGEKGELGVFGLAIGSEGSFYIGRKKGATQPSQYLGEFLSWGGLAAEDVDGGEETLGVAVDRSSNDVYADNETSVATYTPSGSLIERFGSGQLGVSEGLAVNSSTGTVYASDAANDTVDVFTAFVVPDVSTGSVSNLGETSVTVGGVVDPDGLPVTSCVFEYGTTSAYGQEKECAANPGSGSGPVAVSANLTGLEPLTGYHYRLKVANANGSDEGRDRTFLTPEPVALSEEAVSDVSSTSALFSARVDPGGADTAFHFEYGTSVSYGESLPVPVGDLGSETSSVPVSVRVEGLSPQTTYHVRLVASNLLGVVYGPDQTFTTQAGVGAFALPDGREWEMVSPPAKYGAGIEPLDEALVEAAEDGSAIAYLASAPIVANPAGNPSPILPAEVLSRRGAGGWSTEDIAPPLNAGDDETDYVTNEYRFFSSDLSSALVEPLSGESLSPEATERTPYLRDDSTGDYLPLVTAGNVPAGTKFAGEYPRFEDVHVVVGTPDLSHVLLTSPAPLTAKAIAFNGETTEWNVYEWSGGRLQLVNVLPDGAATQDGGQVGGSEGNRGQHRDARHAVSNDGSRVFWTEGGAVGNNHGPLYMRDMVSEETVQVGPAGSEFQIASADGSKVFFTGSNGVLYVYDTVAGTLTELTAGAEVQGEVLGASEDGSDVYFVTNAALSGAENENARKETAVSGQPGEEDLYIDRYDTEDKKWEATFIAVLSGEDFRDWSSQSGCCEESGGMTGRVSPNGRFVAFMSDRSLTGYDNRDAGSGASDEEVFLYDEAANHLVCVSCNPTGERPTGILDKEEFAKSERPLFDRARLWTGRWLAADIPGRTLVGEESWQLVPYEQRYLSDEGRLFFNSFDSLVAQATNGKSDVYEYEPGGVGSCGGPGGCVSLISPGTSSEESVFMDASESGNDVFFLTAARLVPQDVDSSFDVYDAHACSSLSPCVSAPVAPPPCSSGDACKAAPSPQPAIFGAPASATFSGAGNVIPAPTAPAKVTKKKTVKCPKGKTRNKHGKCVKKSKSKKAKKSAKKSSRDRRGK